MVINLHALSQVGQKEGGTTARSISFNRPPNTQISINSLMMQMQIMLANVPHLAQLGFFLKNSLLQLLICPDSGDPCREGTETPGTSKGPYPPHWAHGPLGGLLPRQSACPPSAFPVR